jgi:hypothetical protein
LLVSGKGFGQGQSNATAGSGDQACFNGTFFQIILFKRVTAIQVKQN